ncbi:MAG: valine--tRNA ligase [Pseudomonadota bacterium]
MADGQAAGGAPNTDNADFPKTFDAAAEEARIARIWDEQNCFRAGANAKKGADSFCIVIPPPNVTGSLHMGHALNNTLQDILTRWRRMQGFDTLWQPGQDHAGIATQMVVERKLAEAGEPGRRELGRKAFLEKVWAWKEESGDTIINQLKRLGASCDWSRNRFTMDPGFHDAVLRVFVGLYKDGLIYRDKRLVNWDPHFETAISDLEVEPVTVQPGSNQGKLWRFRYPLADGLTYRHPVAHDDEGDATDWEERDYLVVATTRPETVLGDTGVAVHPDDERYKDLVGKHAILPIVGRRIPIVADEYADPEKGTGAVKMTPAHDFNDFEVGKRQGLRMINVMTPKAAITLFEDAEFWTDTPFASGPIKAKKSKKDDAAAALRKHCEANRDLLDLWSLDGLDRFEARKRVLAMMEARGLYDGADDNPHEVPHGDRSKVVIEPYLTDQWFVDAATLAKPAIEAVRNGETKFAPQNWEKTYFQWLEHIEPWCVSRQLWWGHQIPVWYGPDGEPFCEATEKEAKAAAKAHYGKSVKLRRDEDVLDTWFSSGLWPMGTLGWPKQTRELTTYYQTDVLITGFDIIFFWVARMMMMGMHFMKDEAGRDVPPFHTVYINSIVTDEEGKKMSKSVGNVLDPLDIVDGCDLETLVAKRRAGVFDAKKADAIEAATRKQFPKGLEPFGADALRFALAALESQGQRALKLSMARVEGSRNFGTKLWNAARFANLNGCAPDPKFKPEAATRTVNKWIVGETARVAAACDEALESYRFNDYAARLYAHTWGVYCDWYLEFAKPLLQGDDPVAQAETRATAAWALEQILKLMHPVSPFITESLWEATAGPAGRKKRLVHADWPSLDAATLADPEADAELGWIVRLIEAVRSVRAEMNVPPSAEAVLVLTAAEPAATARLERNWALVKRLARLASWETAESAPKGSITVALEGAVANLPLADVIDVSAEQARLEKAMAKTRKEADGLTAKLGNEAFLAKAPEEVVEEQRERLAAAEAELEKLSGALMRLAEMA